MGLRSKYSGRGDFNDLVTEYKLNKGLRANIIDSVSGFRYP